MVPARPAVEPAPARSEVRWERGLCGEGGQEDGVLRGKVIDDAGQRVPLIGGEGDAEWPVSGDARANLLVRRVGVALGVPNGWLVVLGVLMVVLAIGGCGGLSALFSRHAPAAPRWLVLVLQGVIAVATARAWLHLRVKAMAREVASLVLSEGLCASCGYNLHGLEAQGDLVRCPECSAAWLAARIVRSAPFARGATMGRPLRKARYSMGARWPAPDARGVAVEIAHPWLRFQLRAASKGRRERLLRAREAVARASRFERTFGLTLAWLGPVVFGAFGAGVGGWVGALIGAAPFVLLALAGTYGNFAFDAASTRDALVRLDLCPSCTADLAPVTRDAQGRRACPVCLAVWADPAPAAARAPAEPATGEA
jgi:Zn-finger nucleic acid-binding protein